MANIGEAYGFFYYKGKTEDILKKLPLAIIRARSPLNSSYELTEGVTNLNTSGDSALAEIVEEAQRCHMSHVLKATLPNEGNRKAAMELGDVLNGLYTSLYDQKEPFNEGIVYKRGGRYVFKRE